MVAFDPNMFSQAAGFNMQGPAAPPQAAGPAVMPQQAPPPQAAGAGFYTPTIPGGTMPTTGNSATDALLAQMYGRQNFLNQQRQQDMANMWQSALQSAKGGSYDRGRRFGQQLFTDVFAPMIGMKANSAGGFEGAYEFMKDSYKRLDANKSDDSDRQYKAAQTLGQLAKIAESADSTEFEKMGKIAGMYKTAQDIENQKQMAAYHKWLAEGEEQDAIVKKGTTGFKIKQEQEKASQQEEKSKGEHQKVQQQIIKTQTDYQKLHKAYTDAYQAYAMAPSKISAQNALANYQAARAKHEELKALTEQARAGTEQAKQGAYNARADATRTGAADKSALSQQKLKTEQGRSGYWKNKAQGIDPGAQAQARSHVRQAIKDGRTPEEMTTMIGSKYKKGSPEYEALMAALQEETAPDDDEDEGDDE